MLTIHRSKGLEFPIVYFPYLWEPTWIGRDEGARVLPRPGQRRRAHDRRRARRAGLPAPTCSSTWSRRAARTCGSPTSRSPARATRRSCGGPARPTRATRRSRGCCSRARRTAPSRRRGRRRRATSRPSRGCASWPRRAPGRIGVERSTLEAPRPWAGLTAAGRRRSTPRAFARELDLALAAHVVQRHHGRRLRGARGERARGGAARRRARRRPRRCRLTPPRRGRRCARRRRCWRTMGVGVRVGTLVHRVLEATDFAARRPARRAGRPHRRGAGAAAGRARRPRARRRRAWRRRSRRRSGRSPATCGCATSRARTGSTSSASSCRSSAATTRPAGSRSSAIAAVLAEHLPPGDPLAGYAARLSDPSLRDSVRGFLTGSLDLVAAARRASASRSPTTRRTGSPRRARR